MFNIFAHIEGLNQGPTPTLWVRDQRMWVKIIYRWRDSSSLAAPGGIQTYTIRKWQEESFNQNILRDPHMTIKRKLQLFLSCLHFYFPIHAGLSS